MAPRRRQGGTKRAAVVRPWGSHAVNHFRRPPRPIRPRTRTTCVPLLGKVLDGRDTCAPQPPTFAASLGVSALTCSVSSRNAASPAILSIPPIPWPPVLDTPTIGYQLAV